jgi:hypothetical protein
LFTRSLEAYFLSVRRCRDDAEPDRVLPRSLRNAGTRYEAVEDSEVVEIFGLTLCCTVLAELMLAAEEHEPCCPLPVRRDSGAKSIAGRTQAMYVTGVGSNGQFAEYFLNTYVLLDGHRE